MLIEDTMHLGALNLMADYALEEISRRHSETREDISS